MGFLGLGVLMIAGVGRVAKTKLVLLREVELLQNDFKTDDYRSKH